jgi:hypothetical protein
MAKMIIRAGDNKRRINKKALQFLTDEGQEYEQSNSQDLNAYSQVIMGNLQKIEQEFQSKRNNIDPMDEEVISYEETGIGSFKAVTGGSENPDPNNIYIQKPNYTVVITPSSEEASRIIKQVLKSRGVEIDDNSPNNPNPDYSKLNDPAMVDRVNQWKNPI